MAIVTTSKKACSVNPLKMSQPIGGSFAFIGLRGAMPLLHGSQGCTSFGLTLFVRHFKEAVPMQTTAMSEVATVLGGYENVEQAILNIYNRAKPEIIGINSTGVTETKGDSSKNFRWSMSRPPISRTRSRTAGRRPSRGWSRCWSIPLTPPHRAIARG
jgi:nitrogenase molybdenum-iron protein NifN